MGVLDPTELFTWSSQIDAVVSDHGSHQRQTLVITMGGLTEAGGARRMMEERLLEGFSNYKLGSFDTDQLYDYAGHRPTIIFDRDHFRQYDKPEIALYQVNDSNDQPFLLLSGPEPSFKWEAMAEAIEHIIDVLNIKDVVLLQSIPAPAPHTRPIFISKFASKPDLVGIFDGIPATVQMSASFTGMLTIRLGEHNIDVIGLIAHVPHYLADGDYPPAAIA